MKSFSNLRLEAIRLTEFQSWWKQGLLAWLPESLRQRLYRPAKRLQVMVTESALTVVRQPADGFQQKSYPLSSLMDKTVRTQLSEAARGHQVILQLPKDTVLQKTVSLPLQAERNLRQVAEFEMDRWTPFSAGEVYYDVLLVQKQVDFNRLSATLFLVPRSCLDGLLATLRSAGMVPERAEITHDERVNLLPEDYRPRPPRLQRWLVGGLWLAALSSIAVAAWLPLQQRQDLIDKELQPRVQVLAGKTREILALRDDLQHHIAVSQFLVQKRRHTPLMIALLAELTKILPDDTWVDRLEITGNELRLMGEAASASRLVGLLDSSDRFSGVVFRSPVTTDRRSGKERFNISAQITGIKADKS